MGRKAGRLEAPVDDGAAPRLDLFVLPAGPDSEGRAVRPAAEGAGGGPMDDLVLMEVRGLAGAADGRGVPLRDERLDIGVEAPDSCFVGDLVGDYPRDLSAR